MVHYYFTPVHYNYHISLNRVLPRNITYKQCCKVRLHVVVDLSAWNIASDEKLNVSLKSLDIGEGKYLYCTFQW